MNEKMQELVERLSYAKRATMLCLEDVTVSVDFHGLAYWAAEVEKIRKELLTAL